MLRSSKGIAVTFEGEGGKDSGSKKEAYETGRNFKGDYKLIQNAEENKETVTKDN